VRQAALALDSDLTGRKALPLQAESQRSAAPEEQATAIRRGSRAAQQLAEGPELEAEAEEVAPALPSVAR
jgi:hypothetical protein